jgi:CcmD family protein
MDRNFEYMFFGFLAAWMVVIIYVISLAVRERSLRRELDRVKRLVEERESEAGRRELKR